MDSDSGTRDDRATTDQGRGTSSVQMGARRAGSRPAQGDESLVPRPSSLLSRPSSPRLPLESRLPLIVLVGGLPAAVVALVWLWTGDHGVEVRWTLTVVIAVAWLGAAAVARERVIRPLQTLSNLLSALREGDF